ncbi:MAG: M15 family metallopeptidase [Prevotella sp.]|nr:M15 family metallopeptidase [Prevotella sp.]
MRKVLFTALLLIACTNPSAQKLPEAALPQEATDSSETSAIAGAATTDTSATTAALPRTQPDSTALSATARSMERQGMVNVQSLDPTIEVSLMYSRPDNFTGRVLYDDLREGYLHPKAAKALVVAQQRLKQLRPELSLIIFDATRPMSIQQKMWDVVKNTPKYFYVSNPARGGGMHNYGMAVDISICRVGGDTIPMGATVDFMGDLSHIDKEDLLVKNKRITEEARANRKLLREVMAAGGFMPLRTEWWHFNLCSRQEAKRYYKVIK